jgi:hypothetical protein
MGNIKKKRSSGNFSNLSFADHPQINKNILHLDITVCHTFRRLRFFCHQQVQTRPEDWYMLPCILSSFHNICIGYRDQHLHQC